MRLQAKSDYRVALYSILGRQDRFSVIYHAANAGSEGESTQDLLFGGQNIIAENVPCWQNRAALKTDRLCGHGPGAPNVSAKE